VAPPVASELDTRILAPGVAAMPAAARARTPWRCVVAGPVIALVAVVACVVATRAGGVPIRDPKHVTLTRLLLATGFVVASAAIDAAIRGCRRSRRMPPSGSELLAAWRERWTGQRVLAVGITLVSFFVTYGAYRNLKSVVPLIRPGALFDRQLANLDRSVLGGSAPAALLHDLLGTGVAAHVLSAVYMLFFAFIPISLALALVFVSDLRAALLYTTALSANWLLAAASYYLIPSIGPFQADPAAFATLPATAVSELQALMVDERAAFLRDPALPGAAQSIGAFASLHVSIWATAALAAHLLGLGRLVRVAAWALVLLTVTATVYFGWHYLADDVAGAVIAATALAVARAATGFDPRGAVGRPFAPASEPKSA